MSKKKAPDRDYGDYGRVKTMVWIDKDLYKKVQILKVLSGKKIYQLIDEAIEDLLEKYPDID